MKIEGPSIRVGTDYHLWLEAAHRPHEMAAELPGVLQLSIWIAQSYHFFDTQRLRRLQLLLVADLRKPIRRHVGIVRTLAAVAAKHVIDTCPLPNPVGHHAAAGNLSVVRMGSNHQCRLGNLFHGPPPYVRLLVTSYSATISIRCQDEIFTAERGNAAPFLRRMEGAPRPAFPANQGGPRSPPA